MGFIDFLKQNRASTDDAIKAAGNDADTVQKESTSDSRAKANDINADKIFIRNVAISFIGIIICIVMLSASSYAWFSTSIESSNTITSSVYKLDIEVLNGEVIMLLHLLPLLMKTATTATPSRQGRSTRLPLLLWPKTPPARQVT